MASLFPGVLAVCLLTGCSPARLQVAPIREDGSGPFGFLQIGSTTREEALLRLGSPHAHFAGERILVFAYSQAWQPLPGMAGTWLRGLRGAGSGTVTKDSQELVLVFNQDGVLTRMSLVVAE